MLTVTAPIEDVASHFAKVGDRPARWMSLSELRNHPPTMSLNREPFLRMCDQFGSDLEHPPVSVRLPEPDPPPTA